MAFCLMKTNAKLKNFIASTVKAASFLIKAPSDKKSEGAFFIRFSDYISVIWKLWEFCYGWKKDCCLVRIRFCDYHLINFIILSKGSIKPAPFCLVWRFRRLLKFCYKVGFGAASPADRIGCYTVISSYRDITTGCCFSASTVYLYLSSAIPYYLTFIGSNARRIRF